MFIQFALSALQDVADLSCCILLFAKMKPILLLHCMLLSTTQAFKKT